MLVVGFILSLLAFYPQWNLRSIRGAEFNGAFATYDLDEMAYASYIQALIEGRPRKNDPYTGRDQSPGSPQPESLFSIQFVTAYFAAAIASIAGVGVWQIMPVISILSAVLTGWALLLFLYFVTRDVFWSSAGTLVVLVGAALISGIGVYSSLFENGVAYPYFPFLRRHIPSLSFPFIFGVLLFGWLGLNSRVRTHRLAYAIAVGICFSVLVFSYFYLWTAAAAVLGGWLFFTVLFCRETRSKDLKFLTCIAGLCLVPLIPYSYLLTNRNEMMDKAQLLVYTRELDLYRNVEIIGAVVLGLLVILLLFKRSANYRKEMALAAALSVSPIVVFNQQFLTGRSLQPFHYEYYVINYIVLISVVILVILLSKIMLAGRKKLSAVIAILVATSAVGWGRLEAVETTRFWDSANIVRDEAMPVNIRLRELSVANIDAARQKTTLNLESLQGDSQPTVAPNAVLWARHQHVFVGLANWNENITRYFKLIYYSDLDSTWLRNSLTNCANIESCMALFGWDRFNATLSPAARPLTSEDIEDAVQRYEAFTEEFSEVDASVHPISFVIVRIADGKELTNFQRWYEIDEGEVLGQYILYNATVKTRSD